LESTAPEYRLLTLIDQLLADDGGIYFSGCTFEGTAERLEQRLRRDDALRYQVDRILSFPAACGTYLGRLAAKAGSRVSGRKVNGQTTWTIDPLPLPATVQASGPAPGPGNPLIAGLAPICPPLRRRHLSLLDPIQGGEVGQVYHDSMSIDVK
jgi:hypothetical protein